MWNAICGGLVAMLVAEFPQATTLAFTITFKFVENNRPSQAKVCMTDAGQSIALNLKG
jgi:hypothetical protein